jgi:ABC-type dipeptide/oligopeptide/nickel transport system permease component
MEKEKNSQSQKTTLIIVAIITILFLIGITIGVVYLAKSDAQITSQVRDIFIIILVMESFLIGAALIVLIIQLALLSNLLQNEIRPILSSTKETIRTVKGTSQFVSERAVKPIVTIGGLLAGGRKLFEIVGFIRKENKKE